MASITSQATGDFSTRIRALLSQAESAGHLPAVFDASLLEDAAEKRLFTERSEAAFKEFCERVMVMVDDSRIRGNRLALLQLVLSEVA